MNVQTKRLWVAVTALAVNAARFAYEFLQDFFLS